MQCFHGFGTYVNMRPERFHSFSSSLVNVSTTTEFPQLADVNSERPKLHQAVPFWFWTVGALGALLLLLYKSVQLLRSGRSSRSFELDFTLALRSGVMFLVMLFPLTQPALRNVNENIQIVYVWLPLWYISSIRKSIGEWIQICLDATTGTLLAMGVTWLLNAAMPGGGGGLGRGSGGVDQGLLPGGYDESLCLLCASAVAYAVCMSPLTTDAKQFFFGTFGSLLVLFMSPALSQRVFRTPLLFEAQKPQWTSILQCHLYLTLTALALSAATLLMRVPYCFSCSLLASSHAAEDLSDLAKDLWKGVQLLLKSYRSGTKEMEIETLGQHFAQLMVREELLSQALWAARKEACLGRAELLRRLSSLLLLVSRCRRVAVAALEALRDIEGSRGQQAALRICEFESSAGTVLRTVTAVWWPWQNGEDREASVIDCVEHAELADAALVACLGAAWDPSGDLGHPEQTSPAEDQVGSPAAAFAETLREIPRAMRDFLLDKADASSQLAESPPPLRNRIDEGRQAAAYVLAWAGALLWCIRYRNAATAAVLIAWLWRFRAVTLGCTLNELLGVTGGVLLGSLPSLFVRLSPTFRHAPGPPGPRELFVCFTIMYLLWVVATYYAQVQAFQWRVAALFWSCFGGVEMLRDFGLAEHFRSYIWRQRSWDTLVDLTMGCSLLVALEVILSLICLESSDKAKAADAAAGCLSLSAEIADVMQDRDGFLLRGQAAELWMRAGRQQERLEDLSRQLSQRLAEARFWQQQTSNSVRFWDVPWRRSLVDRILDQCDAILTAANAVAWSSQRYGGAGPSALLLKAVVPETLGPRLRRCAEALHQALAQRGGSEKWTLGDEEPPLGAPGKGAEASTPAAAAAAAALRGAVGRLCVALGRVEAALRAEESLSFSSWLSSRRRPPGAADMSPWGSEV